MSVIIVEFQGFRDGAGKYIVKELAMASPESSVERIVFKPPYDWFELDSETKRANIWCTRRHHGLSWNEGDVDYSELEDVLLRYTHTYEKIITKGATKKSFLEGILGREVIDISPMTMTSLRHMPSDTTIECDHWGSCAVHSVRKIQLWMKNIFPLFSNEPVDENVKFTE